MGEDLPDLSYIIDLMKKRSGVVFTKEKSYIIITKLFPLLEKYNFSKVEDLIIAVKSYNNEDLIADIIDHLTTNETSFFRDRFPFDVIKQLVPGILAGKEKSEIKILCAACSTGQEPYSMVMNLLESRIENLSFKITAIDIANFVIEKAKLGIYNQFEVQRGLPITLLVKYFNQIDKNWQIKEECKKYISFHKFNLMDSMSSLGAFDIVFCRNVLIYFDHDQRQKVLNNILKTIANKGFLVVGATELLNEMDEYFQRVEEYSGIYQKKYI